MEQVIHTAGVTKVYNHGMPDEVQAVRDISLEIEKGAVTIIKGPSGSGKTSLLSLIGCMSRPTEGSIVVNGKDVAKLPERFLTLIRRKTFGFIFQQLNLVRGLSVIENVMLPLYPSGMPFGLIRERALSILEKLGIGDKSGMLVQTLSGGQQQRVAIARAVVNEPDIVIADEPTAHLDTGLSEELVRIFNTLRAEGKTIIIATHDPLIYENEFVSRIIEMRDGMITGISTSGPSVKHPMP